MTGRHRAPVVHNTARRVGTVAALTGGAVFAPAAAGLIPASADTLDSIAKCESGGNATAHNPHSSASGLFQFLTSTWLANGGGEYAPTAAQATPAQQRLVAERLLAREGTAPWNASRNCWGGHLGEFAPHVGAAEPARTIPSASVVVHENVVPMAASTYTVVRGDCLSLIAQRFGVTVGDLYNANRSVVGGNPNLIFPGQVLQITGTSTGQHSDPGPAHAAPFAAPLSSLRVTSPFGDGRNHQGIDLHAPLGTPGYAVADGVIRFARHAGGFGLWVVERSQIDGLTVDFVYGHLNSLIVKEGEVVHAGEQIINTGNNGDNGPGSVDPHLHFGVNIGGVGYSESGHYVDPTGWLRAHGVSI